MVVVVLPTPPFWLHIDMTRALPWVVSGLGSGITGIGRPVGPISPVVAGTTGASGSGSRRSKGRGSVMGGGGVAIASLGSVGWWRGPGGAGGATDGGISGAADPRPNREPNRAPSLIEVSSALGSTDTQQPNLSTRRHVADAPGTLGAPSRLDQAEPWIPPAPVQ